MMHGNSNIRTTIISGSSHFWDFTQRTLVGSNRRFGTTYRPIFKSQFTNIRCAKSNKSEVFIHTAAEACNHA